MKRLYVILSLLLSCCVLAAQEQGNAVVLEDIETFTMSSVTSGSFEVRRSVLVLNEKGLGEAEFREYTDKFRTLSSFKGNIKTVGGKDIKIKKDDLVKVSLASGLAEEGYLYGYDPSAAFPFTVTYEYTMSYRGGFASFPSFFPVSGEKTRVEKASYCLKVPAGTEINFISSKAGEVRKETGKTDSYSWEMPVFEGFVYEGMMPSWKEIIPFVMASPAEFNFAGVPGRQGSWQAVGKWCYDLKAGTEELPADVVSRLEEMTGGAQSDLEKIRILYDNLRTSTRYVSIQLGIGGYKPFPAAEVNKTGFGDCKGLSNYMQAMLKAVGIPSFYTLVNTDRAHFLPGYSGIGQMNHVMLCVPLSEKQDTLWLECTDPSVPLGYRHADVAGHDVVLATEDGGVPVRVRPYEDSLRRECQDVEVRLEADGSASVNASRSLYLDETEAWTDFRSIDPERQARRLTSGLAVQPQAVTVSGIRDNFADYDGAGYVPWMQIDYSFSSRKYADAGKNRLFVPANPFPRKASLQRSKRVNDLVCLHGAVARDRIRIVIPDGYAVESLPKNVSLDTEWGVFSARTTQDGNVVTILYSLRMNAFREPAARYDDLRTFLRAVEKSYTASVVLVDSRQ